MTIRNILSLFFVVLVAELVTLAFVLSVIVSGQQELEETDNRRYQAYKLADELRQSSDDLTRMARTYVATGDPTFEQHFRDILAIRNGTKPRPPTYDRIFWDFVVAAGDPLDTEGPAISLLDRMASLDLTPKELEQLKLAQANSDALVSLENKAMNAVKGLFDDGSQGYTVRRAPDLDLARSIMFGKEYHAAKAAIMRPIDSFLVSLEKRMNSAVAKHREHVGSYVTMATFLVVLTLASFGIMAMVIRRRIMSPVNKLVKQSDAIRKGDYGYQAELELNDEIGILGGALNRMSKSISDDISKRRKSEKALRESEKAVRNSRRLLETILDNVPAHIFLRDLEGRYLLINAKYAKRYGVSKEDTLGKKVHEVVPKELAELFSETDRDVIREGRPIENETLIPNEDGDRIFAAVKFPIIDSNNQMTSIGGIAFEITERKHAERERLRQSQKMDVLGQLTGSIAHDFNNILTVLDCNIDLLKSKKIGQEQQKSLIKNCLEAVELGSKLTSRLTKFARKEPLSETRCDLNKLILGFSDLLSRSVGNDVFIEYVLPADTLPVLVDAALLEVALLNLALNACDAMPEGGKITVSLDKTNIDEVVDPVRGKDDKRTYALLQVSDTGIGMAPEIKERVFEAFFTTKDEDKGTGLGLNTVQDLVQSSGGFVEIESELKKGTAVKVFLPLYEKKSP